MVWALPFDFTVFLGMNTIASLLFSNFGECLVPQQKSIQQIYISTLKLQG